MAQCKLTPREFIINAFSPQVAAICSVNAEATCQKNNLSFTELLQPFCRINIEGHIKDPHGTTILIRSLQICVKDVNYYPPEPNIARKLLNESVNFTYNERTTVVSTASLNLDIPVSVPWFEAWRDTFLNVQFPSDHEFTKHFIACMIVVSTMDDNPLEKLQQISAQLNQSIPGKLPKWFNNNALRYYILIHDTFQNNKNIAEDIFTEMKNIYGPNNCFFLPMNSRPFNVSDDCTQLPDPWSQFIVKYSDCSGNNDYESSPRTPADTIGVSSMPNAVNTESEKSISQTGTPVTSKNFTAVTPDGNERINISSEISEAPITHLEVGQEAVPPTTIATIHPLSPKNELSIKSYDIDRMRSHLDENSPININVWADSPTHAIPQHGVRLSTKDLEKLKLMMSDFCLKSLLPYVEKQISLLNDLISNKKGVSKSLFSATKRWFGTNKPGVPGSAPANAVIYTAESPELQLRRLGDLCFMFGHYTFAYQAYHNAKRDFAADQAWVYYAGALEMAALSAFMMDEMIRKTIEYMDDAITTYLNTCKMSQFATRATLLSAECLKNRGLYGEAAKQLIRMTSEDSDLRSALLLEQAAYCFISPKMVRKYAFHAVLAGHRFSKAGQKKHSLRCYKQAYQVYKNKGWSLAEDHIHFTIGRQAASLKQVLESVTVFEKLLSATSKQPALQQAAFLREFLYIHNLLTHEMKKSSQTNLPILPLPLIEDNQIKVLLGPLIKPGNNIELVSQILSFSQDADDVRWSKLEEILLSKAQGTPPMIFKPTVTIYTHTSNNANKPNAVVKEPIYLCITLSNPLLIPLPLSNLKLLWSFNNEGCIINNESSVEYEEEFVETLKIDSIILQPGSKQTVVLTLKPKKIGQLKILGLNYNLSNPIQTSIDQTISSTISLISGKRLFKIQGPKLKNFKEKAGISLYGLDLRLDMNIVEKGPFMQITFTPLSPEMLCGELQRMEVTLTNIGNAPLKNIYLGSTNPKLFALVDQEQDFKKGQIKKMDELIIKISLPPNKNDTLLVGDSLKMTLWICAPHIKGNHRLDLLFYYENFDSKSVLKHRLSRHSWYLTVLDSIQSSAIVRRSAIINGNFSMLNLIMQVKNSNQVHDPFMNEIELTDIAIQSDAWMLINSADIYGDIKIQPQEIRHFLLKLVRKADGNLNLSNINLSKNISEVSANIPYLSFIKKRHIMPLDANDVQNENQQMRIQMKDKPILSSMKLDSIVIIRWKAKVTEGGVVIRNTIGQHYIDLHYLDKSYNYPIEKQLQPIEYNGRLKIFGPDINISDAQTSMKNDQYSDLECQQNLVWFYLKYSKNVTHDFTGNRICIVPVMVNIQNNSESYVNVKVDTVGTSSQTLLLNIKTKLYSPQASTSFRYVGQTSLTLRLEPYEQQTIKLQAIFPAYGTYDLSSRLEVSAKVQNNINYTLQKWNIESVCIINSLKILS
ncbi:PREDICTED: trafficking protein particle complex subunit 8 [Ceratosolen solmsi marchali]|uniref:Trafficking protein particle complex subunit 8 n=1 Tax=Ceratosolen solmsi marchali TaxID=326594 RepID=A0AAJ7E011_9HYME|nr:PREDICTED: trafficking protein particle complex subunit 8 [Ceratosolen solmsi marchali]